MTSAEKLSFSIENSDISIPLGVEVWVDDQKILDCNHVTEIIEFKHDFVDDEADHKLQIVMKNKTNEHTQVDDSGNIIKDACLNIKNLCFDEIELGYVFTELAVYRHDFNGSQETIKDKFFGTMGCNGTVSLEFSTPIYLWLLENM